MVQEEPSGRAALGVLMGPDEPLGKGCAVQLRAGSGGSVILHDFYPSQPTRMTVPSVPQQKRVATIARSRGGRMLTQVTSRLDPAFWTPV